MNYSAAMKCQVTSCSITVPSDAGTGAGEEFGRNCQGADLSRWSHSSGENQSIMTILHGTDTSQSHGPLQSNAALPPASLVSRPQLTASSQNYQFLGN